jgi:hypothetical protein
MIAGQPFNLLEAMYIVVTVCVLCLGSILVLLKFAVIVELVRWTLFIGLFLLFTRVYKRLRTTIKYLRHKLREHQHHSWMKAHRYRG